MGPGVGMNVGPKGSVITHEPDSGLHFVLGRKSFV